MDSVKRLDGPVPEIQPWGSWGQTNTRILVDEERFDHDDYHQARGSRFIHLGLLSNDTPVYAAVLDFGRFAPKNRWDKIDDTAVMEFVSSPRFPWIFGAEFPPINVSYGGELVGGDDKAQAWEMAADSTSYYVPFKIPTVLEDKAFVKPVLTTLPYSVIAFEMEHHVDVEAILFDEDNLICRTCVRRIITFGRAINLFAYVCVF